MSRQWLRSNILNENVIVKDVQRNAIAHRPQLFGFENSEVEYETTPGICGFANEIVRPIKCAPIQAAKPLVVHMVCFACIATAIKWKQKFSINTKHICYLLTRSIRIISPCNLCAVVRPHDNMPARQYCVSIVAYKHPMMQPLQLMHLFVVAYRWDTKYINKFARWYTAHALMHLMHRGLRTNFFCVEIAVGAHCKFSNGLAHIIG